MSMFDELSEKDKKEFEESFSEYLSETGQAEPTDMSLMHMHLTMTHDELSSMEPSDKATIEEMKLRLQEVQMLYDDAVHGSHYLSEAQADELVEQVTGELIDWRRDFMQFDTDDEDMTVDDLAKAIKSGDISSYMAELDSNIEDADEFDFTSVDTQPSNPYLDKVMEAANQYPARQNLIMRDVRTMIRNDVLALAEQRDREQINLESMEGQLVVIRNYWESENLSEKDGISAYVASATGYDGTPSEYEADIEEFRANMESEMTEAKQALYDRVREAAKFTSLDTHARMPYLVDSEMRELFDSTFGKGDFERYESEQFNSFLADMKSRHVGIDYSKSADAAKESVPVKQNDKKIPTPALTPTPVSTPKSTPVPGSGSGSIPHKGEGVYNVATPDDDWSFDDVDTPSDDGNGGLGK